MKRVLAAFISVLLVLSVCACGGQITENKNKIRVVTTIFPIYDWVRNVAIGVDEVEISLLMDSGVDLHSFQPTVEDIVKISNCDIFVYVGGESDKWVDDALKEGTNKEMITINLFDVLGDGKCEEELKEGMQGEDEEDKEEVEYDEHIWLSLKNAKVLCGTICDGLCRADSKNSKAYKLNKDVYIDKLDALDKEYEQAVVQSSKNTLVFGDRFPFRYMTEDYNIDYYAAFIGCSAESEASFKTIIFLANKVDELELNSIIKIESSDGLLAKTIKDNTATKDAQILTLDSMQSVTAKDMSGGVTYINICKENLEVLREALK